MEKKTVYLMRHGQTLFNVRRKIQGWCDAPLTALGKYQAQIAGEYFTKNDVIFDAAYASTSERAADTLELVTGGNVPYERVKGLKEWNFGTFEGESEDLNPPLPYLDFFVKFGGESQDELAARMNQAMLEVADKSDGTNILVVSHGAACMNFMREWQEYSDVPMFYGFKNCGVMKFEYEQGRFKLLEVINHDFSKFEGD